jgi:hypothetical protein
VHRFPVPIDDDIVSARCEYGGSFAASISNGSLRRNFIREKANPAGYFVKIFLSRRLASPS